ncbi:MAG: hypothetical protein LBB28_06180 [Synergistaceae bacterium]|jgi:hypothetical protein|nr:hypothetical protein [Synergistaceae bacterium]
MPDEQKMLLPPRVPVQGGSPGGGAGPSGDDDLVPAGAGGGGAPDDDYDYGNGGAYLIRATLEVDGRESGNVDMAMVASK